MQKRFVREPLNLKFTLYFIQSLKITAKEFDEKGF